MTRRRYSPRCAECRQKTMAIDTVPFRIQIDHDGKKYDVGIPNLTVPKCTNCGAISVDEIASEQIDKAFRAEAKLLTPSEIREGRIRTGFPQQAEFAQCFGISVSTLSRWENGAQVQQHFHDGVLRAFFSSSDLRTFLAQLHGVANVAPNGGTPILMSPHHGSAGARVVQEN
jgi:DNA-binding transcriptional regulator YiaG